MFCLLYLRMKMNRRISITALFVLVSVVFINAFNFQNESLNYKVMYKWGLVNKQAGHATLSLKRNGKEYNTLLTAASEKWADRFYKVRDTLSGRVTISNFQPLFYEKISNEGGERKHDSVTYSYSGQNVTGTCKRKVWNKKRVKTVDENRTLKASGETIDMLSSFYYMRGLPYEKWNKGHEIKVNLFSGKRKEILTIKYLGTTTIDVTGKEIKCFHISFNFTDPENPKKQTSDGMEAWISADSKRIPLKLEGKLAVGKVQCIYTGS